MKPGFILIIGTLMVCFSFVSAVGGETKKQCPDPNFKYENVSGEKYWQWFARGAVSDLVQGDKYTCGIYSDWFRIPRRFEHFPETFNFIVSKIEIEDRQKKEAGFIRGTTSIFRQYDHLLGTNGEEVLSTVYDEFYSQLASIMKITTGLKFETAKEWFDWWETNKDRLVLSEDGKYLVVKI